jgi:hypothetical protein
MSKRARRYLKVALTAVATTVLVWLPTAAQAGITASGLD